MENFEGFHVAWYLFLTENGNKHQKGEQTEAEWRAIFHRLERENKLTNSTETKTLQH